jgi:hypothetical protein
MDRAKPGIATPIVLSFGVWVYGTKQIMNRELPFSLA